MLNPDVLSNKWLLTAELHITGGAVFYCRGSSVGGDCDEFRIQSTGPTDFNEVGRELGTYVNRQDGHRSLLLSSLSSTFQPLASVGSCPGNFQVRAHGGSMYFESTIVTSWDTPNKTPQATYEGGRSFLNCVSEKLTGDICVGQAKKEMGECRMDIINSEIGYMGYFASESYGLTWKVRSGATPLPTSCHS